MCDRWHKLPSEILAEPASLYGLMQIVTLGTRDDKEGGDMQ